MKQENFQLVPTAASPVGDNGSETSINLENAGPAGMDAMCGLGLAVEGAEPGTWTEKALREAHDQLVLQVAERTTALEAANAALREESRRLEMALAASKAGTWTSPPT